VAKRRRGRTLCVDDGCVTRDQFAEAFGNQPAAAGASSSGVGPEAPVSSSAGAGNADNLGTTTLSEFVPITSEASPDIYHTMGQAHQREFASDAEAGRIFERSF